MDKEKCAIELLKRETTSICRCPEQLQVFLALIDAMNGEVSPDATVVDISEW